jgi:hypothetical protein
MTECGSRKRLVALGAQVRVKEKHVWKVDLSVCQVCCKRNIIYRLAELNSRNVFFTILDCQDQSISMINFFSSYEDTSHFG